MIKKKLTKKEFGCIQNSWEALKSRCNGIYYPKIKVKITPEELYFIWKRDNAQMLEKPCLHRIDNDGHYSLKNCQFLSFSDHCKIKPKWHSEKPVRIVFDVSEPLRYQFKGKCLKMKMNMSDVLTCLIENYLKEE